MIKNISSKSVRQLMEAIENRKDWMGHNTLMDGLLDRKIICKYDRYSVEIDQILTELERRRNIEHG